MQVDVFYNELMQLFFGMQSCVVLFEIVKIYNKSFFCILFTSCMFIQLF